MQVYFNYSGFEEFSPKEKAKKEIRRLGVVCGLGLLGLFTVMYFWGTVYYKITGLFGIPPRFAQQFATHPFISQLFHILISSIMIILPFVIAAKAINFKITEQIPLKAPLKGSFWLSVGLGVGVCLFSSFATSFGGAVFESFGITFPSAGGEDPAGFFGIITAVIATAFFPAFIEEFVMRGIVLGVLRRFGDGFAVFASAFVFGIMHASANQIVFAFVVGLVLGHITVKSGSIWPTIAVHFINNLVSVIFSYIPFDDVVSSLLLMLWFSAVIIITVFCAIKLQGKDAKYFNYDEEEIGGARKIIWFLTSPIIIISTVVSLIIAFFVR